VEKKKKRRRAAGILSLVLCATLLLGFANRYYVYKNHYTDLQQALYTSDENSYSVLFAGGSHMSGAIKPAVLKSSCGISSFNLATGGQELYVTYYLLKEALKRQKPKIVVLDVYYAMSQSEYGDESFTHYVLDSMRLGQNKISAIEESVTSSDRAAYYFPLLLYHSRWSDFSEVAQDWSKYTGTYSGDYGFFGGTNTYGKAMTYTNWDYAACTALAAKQETYLQKFFQLAKEENFQLLLVNFPYEMNSTELTQWAGDAPGKINQIKKEAAAANVPFLDLNTTQMMQTMNFDFATMMNNASHVNSSGADIVSKYIGDYLNGNSSQPLTA
jgi:hypothetical protein